MSVLWVWLVLCCLYFTHKCEVQLEIDLCGYVVYVCLFMWDFFACCMATCPLCIACLCSCGSVRHMQRKQLHKHTYVSHFKSYNVSYFL